MVQYLVDARVNAEETESGLAAARDAIRHAFAEFLLLPTCIITAFLLLATLTSFIDRGNIAWLEPIRSLLETYVFSDARGTSELLSTVASGLIQVTTLTTSLLLIALQQAASSLTHQVYDQFLRRRNNQFCFGYFVGLSLYALVILASVGPVTPVFGAMVTFVFTVVALYLLLVLFYTTIDQMRPVVIIETLHDHVLAARKAQMNLIRKTRRTSCCDAPRRTQVIAARSGFVTRIDLDAIAEATALAGAEVEIVLNVSVGDYVAFQDVLAVVKSHTDDDAIAVGKALYAAIRRESQRDIASDPLDGIEELETIAWTSVSTAQSDPDPGLLTIYNLRDLLARWSSEDNGSADGHRVPVVYTDNVFSRLMSAFESLAVAASESMQHQSYAEILRTFEIMFNRLPQEQKPRAEDLIMRTLSGLGDHVLTAELNGSLSRLIDILNQAGRLETAAAIHTAQNELALSVGKLRSRASRSP